MRLPVTVRSPFEPAPSQMWIRATLAFAALLLGLAAPSVAAPIVWVVNPVSGDIIRMDPRTGVALGSFAPPPADPFDPFSPPLRPGQGDRHLGLSIANGGNTLLYQLGSPPFGTPERARLYGLDPSTGAVKYVVDDVSRFETGPSGLSVRKDLLFWNHAASFGDVHRIEAFSGPGKTETFDWVDRSIAGLGGDDTIRQFGVLCAEPSSSTDCDGGARLIGEFDPLSPGDFFNTFAAPSKDVYGLAFDGRHLYASTASGALFTLDPDTGALVRPPVPLPGPYVFPDGTIAEFTFDIAAVPEPSVVALLGASALVIARRRKPWSAW